MINLVKFFLKVLVFFVDFLIFLCEKVFFFKVGRNNSFCLSLMVFWILLYVVCCISFLIREKFIRDWLEVWFLCYFSF